jgi:hypothetical protein
MKTYTKLYRVKKYNPLIKDYEYTEEEPRFFRTIMQGRKALTRLKNDVKQCFGLFVEGFVVYPDIATDVVFLEFQHQSKMFFSVRAFTRVIEKQLLDTLIAKYDIKSEDLRTLSLLISPRFFKPIRTCETNKIYVVPYRDNMYLGKLLPVADS